MKILSSIFASVLAVSTLATAASSAEITGAGATFPFPLYSKWAEAYRAASGMGLNYQSIGSGGGIRQIRAKTVDFGASDMPLKSDELAKDGLVQFPAAIGALVPAISIPGIEARSLKLTGPILSEIYQGTISKWDDPKIVALNSGLKLPSTPINVVYRSDGSGTTFVWTDFLSKTSEDWKAKIGANSSVSWPVGVGGKGNEGVSATVKQIPNSIGFVEYAFAKQNNLAYALVQNKDGEFPLPGDESFQAAAANADWNSVPGFGVLLNNQPGKNAWPIVSATFILMHKDSEKPDQTAAVLKFFDWAFNNGDKMALELEYVPLPEKLKNEIRAVWRNDLKDKSGKPLF